LEDHGRTTVTASTCNECHHRQIDPMNCAQCHDGGAPMATLELAAGDFSHQVHRDADLACGQCHAAPAMSASDLRCETCHAQHHQPEATCVDCHRGGALDRHPGPVVHTSCSLCHGSKAEGIVRWTRQVCTACHADRIEHNPPADCVLCHDIPPLGGDDAAGLSTARLEGVEPEYLQGILRVWLVQGFTNTMTYEKAAAAFLTG
jgi:hypothetical protein